MYFMKILLILLLICTSNIQTANAQDVFPDKLVGSWTGTMYIFQKGILRDSVGIKFSVDKISDTEWGWKTEYISDKYPLIKDYMLKRDKSIHNLYLIDEGGGVVLSAYLFDNKLYAAFETRSIYLTSSYELTKTNELIFEVTSGKKMEGSQRDEVNNFTVESLQKVVLKRKQ